MITLLILFGLLLFSSVWLMAIYNRLVTLQGRFQSAFDQIGIQLRRRYDLIPNLVETARNNFV